MEKHDAPANDAPVLLLAIPNPADHVLPFQLSYSGLLPLPPTARQDVADAHDTEFSVSKIAPKGS